MKVTTYTIKELNEIEELIHSKDTTSLIKYLSNLKNDLNIYKYLRNNLKYLMNLDNVDIFKTLQKYHSNFVDENMHLLIKTSLDKEIGTEIFDYIMKIPMAERVLKNHKFLADILRDKDFYMIMPLLEKMYPNTQLFQQNIRVVLSSVPFAHDASQELVLNIFNNWKDEIKLKQKKEFFENTLISNKNVAQLLINNKFLTNEEIEQHVYYVMNSCYLKREQLEFLEKNNIDFFKFGYKMFHLLLGEKNQESIDFFTEHLMKKDPVHIENVYVLLQQIAKTDKTKFIRTLNHQYEKIILKNNLDKSLDSQDKKRVFKI